jgi:hypothetical protein
MNLSERIEGGVLDVMVVRQSPRTLPEEWLKMIAATAVCVPSDEKLSLMGQSRMPDY